jgi:outer membrane protein
MRAAGCDSAHRLSAAGTAVSSANSVKRARLAIRRGLRLARASLSGKRMSVAIAVMLAQAKVLTLADALRAGMRAQPQIAQADANTRAALARVGEARAPLLPQLGGTATWSLGNRSAAGVATAGGATAQSWSLGLNATQTVWDASGQLARLGASRDLADAARATAQATRLQLALTIEQQYFSACAARGLANVAHETLDNQDKHLAQIAGFVQAGTRPEIDLAQARSDRANAEVQLINAQNNYALARLQLALSMGSVAGDFEVADESIDVVAGEDGASETLVGEALRARPELAAASAQLSAQRQTVRAAKDTFGPSLALSAGVSDGTRGDGSVGAGWSIGAVLNWSLFSGGLSYYTVKETQATQDALTAQRDALLLQLRLQVVQAQLSVQAAKQALVAARQASANTGEQLRLAEGRYRQGVGSVIELGDAQLASSNAAAQEVQAKYNVFASRAALLEAIGRVPDARL